MSQQRWWTTPSVRKWAWELWRYYAWRPSYHLTLTTAEATAYVDMVNKQVVCNPEYPYPPLDLQASCRYLPKAVRDFQLEYLESLIAHEAGHTHHTGTLPAGLLGQLVNIIEDERMERLMCLDFPKLSRLFVMAADVDAAHAISHSGRGGDLIRGCLLHRFTWHHPTWRFVPDGADAHHWPEVRRILEAAWLAPTYDEVIEAAKQILALLGLPEVAPKREDLTVFLEGDGLRLKAKDGKGAASGDQAGADAGTSPTKDKPESSEAENAGTSQGEAAEEQGDQTGPAHMDEADSDEEDEGNGGTGSGRGRGAAPERPTIEEAETPAAELMRLETEGQARLLSGAIRVKAEPERTQSSRERGRFRADRYLTGSERPFDLKVGQQRPAPTHLRLAVDISASMDTAERMAHARRMAFICVRAAQLAGVPVVAVAFDHQVHPLVGPKTFAQTALNAVAGMRPLGDTALSPALRALWQHALPGKSLTIILTDGQLAAMDYRLCRELKEQHDGQVVPILLHPSEQIRTQYEQTFGRCVRMDDPAQLTDHVVSFLRGKLKRV